MKVFEATDAHIEQWITLRQMLWDDPRELHLSEAEEILTSASEVAFLLFDDDNQAIGFIEGALYLAENHKYGYVEGWFVHPDFRAQGLGGRLLSDLEQWFLHRSISLVLSDTIPAEYPLSPKAHKDNGFKDLMTLQIFVKQIDPEAHTKTQ
jgi:GNAT superfamily N-acetyltransferase